MSTKKTVRNLLEDAKRGTPPPVEQEAPIIDLADVTDFEWYRAIEEAAKVTDAITPFQVEALPR
jgi:hypothetical protein